MREKSLKKPAAALLAAALCLTLAVPALASGTGTRAAAPAAPAFAAAVVSAQSTPAPAGGAPKTSAKRGVTYVGLTAAAAGLLGIYAAKRYRREEAETRAAAGDVKSAEKTTRE